METEIIIKAEVSGEELHKTKYEICKVGPDLYAARPAGGENSSAAEIYFEKTSEGWNNFSPATPGQPPISVPESAIAELLAQVEQYHQDNENEKLPNTVAF